MINKFMCKATVIACVVAVILLIYKLVEKLLTEIDKLKKLSDKHLGLFLEAIKWLDLKQKGFSIAGYLADLGYDDIAIYGMSYMGEALKNDLINTPINVKYGIDRTYQNELCDINVYTPHDSLPSVDCVIVSTYGNTSEIILDLQKSLECPIIALEDILDEV